MNAMDKSFVTIVSGVPRSGTSMMMRMLESGGLPVVTDGLRKADDDNPRGYYEFEPVKRLGQDDASWLFDSRGKVVKVIYAFLPKLPPNHSYKVIFMRRDLDEVVASQKVMLRRRDQTDALAPQQLIDTFNDHLRNIDLWLSRQPNVSVHYCDYGSVIADPGRSAADIEDFLGLGLDVEAMSRSVDPALHRNRSMAAENRGN